MTIIDNKKENQILVNIESIPKQEEDDDNNDQEELERITHNLQDDLDELDEIEKVDIVRKEGEQAPEGSKAGGDIVTLGSLLLTLGTSAASTAVPNLVNALQSWLSRNDKRKISLEIGGDKMEVTGISDKEQQRLVDAWISHHMEKNLDDK
jgi:hypothetical protein